MALKQGPLEVLSVGGDPRPLDVLSGSARTEARSAEVLSVGGELRATVREAASTVQPDADEVTTQYAEQFVAMGVGLVACRAQCPRCSPAAPAPPPPGRGP